jgi:preprotein translocase subunit YajC
VLLAQEAGGSPVSSLVFFAVLLLVAYLLVIRPQRSRARALAQVRASLEPGARVMTSAGLHATVASVDDDGTVLLEIAPGVQARFVAQAVIQVLEQATTTGTGPDEAA